MDMYNTRMSKCFFADICTFARVTRAIGTIFARIQPAYFLTYTSIQRLNVLLITQPGHTLDYRYLVAASVADNDHEASVSALHASL